jgi:hypothetical protein
MDNLVDKFKGIDTTDLPDFYVLTSPLDMALWVLLAAKDKLGIERLSADDISEVLVHSMEVSIKPRAIANAFNRSRGKKVHIITADSKIYYKIMKEGRDYLIGSVEETLFLQLHYFEPGKPYKSKKVLREKVFPLLSGPLKIVDPYCGIRTLDLVTEGNTQKIQLLTRLENISNKKKQEEFVREIAEFKTEHPIVEIRNWTKSELHDRYIISESSLVILGQSIKDLGTKESFAVVFERQHFESIFDDLLSAFNRRWNGAELI